MTLSEIRIGELKSNWSHLEMSVALLQALRWDSAQNQPLRDRWLEEFKRRSEIASECQFKITGITQPFRDLSDDTIDLLRDLSRSELLTRVALDFCLALYTSPISDLADDAEMTEKKWAALEYFFALRDRFNYKRCAFFECVLPPVS